MAGAYTELTPDVLVNTTTTGLQTDPTITALADGGFVAIWTDGSASGADVSGNAVRGQRYDALGNRVGTEFLVNTTTANAQELASVAALSGGGFVVTWSDSSTAADPDLQGIRAQVFDAGGAKVGSELLVNTQTRLGQTNSTVTGLADGGFAVSWTDGSGRGVDTSGTGVKAQLFTAAGARSGSEFLVNSTTGASQTFPALTSLATGGFVAIWTDASGLGGDPTAPSVKGQIFSASGVKLGSEFLVNTTTASTQDQPVVATLANGGFVVAWRDVSLIGDTSGSGIKAQIFSASGAKVGAEFQVNTTELNTQDQPTITSIPGGGFVIGWRDNSTLAADASGFGIKAQVFNDSGAKLGTEFQVNGVTTGNQQLPAITALNSGNLVFAWSDLGTTQANDADGSVRMRLLAATSGAITDLTLAANPISEAAVQNTVVGSLSGNGAINAAYTWLLIDDSTGGGFRIRGSQLEIRDSLLLDYETAPVVSLTIRATDTFGNTFDKTISLTLRDAIDEDRYAAGPEKLVNVAITGNQQQAALAALTSGNHVAVWSDPSGVGGDTSSYGIKGVILNDAGDRIGGEFLINGQTANSQDNASVVSLATGGFVVTWTDASLLGGDASVTSIKGRLFDAGGTAIGAEFLVNTATADAQRASSVSSLSGGGFVVVWTDSSLQGGDSSVSSIKSRLYDSAGNAIGGEALVNTQTSNRQDAGVVAGLASGGYVVTWADSSTVGGDISKDAVKAQMFGANGAKIGGEFLVNTETAGNQQQQAIVALIDGGFVIAWADGSRIGGDADAFGIKLQRFDANGAKVGGEVLANTTTAGSQMAPTLAALANGGFVVSWSDYSGAGAENATAGVKAQVFDASGAKVAGEFVVNDETLGIQADPAIIGSLDGGFLIGWADSSGQGGDDLGSGLKLRAFDQLGPQGPPPVLVANPDTVSGTEDTVATIDISALLANDVNANGLPFQLVAVTAITGGSVALDGAGHVIFTPSPNFSGSALFGYTIADTDGEVARGRVTVQVAGVNDAPTANGDQVSVSEDGGAIQAALLLANDSDPDPSDQITVASISTTSAQGAALTLSGGSIGYAPGAQFQYLRAGQSVTDSFSYTITDLAGLTSSATVTMTIVGANDAPVNLALAGGAVNENAAGGTVVGTLSASDPDSGDTIRYSLTGTGGGRFVVDAITGVISVAAGALIDFEATPSITVTARATDASGAFVESAYAIAVNNLPEPKSWTGDNGVNIFTAPSNDLWTINGLGGNDVLTGNASADTINGGSGNDTLDGAGGADTLIGGTGNDIYFVDNAGDQVTENTGEGADTVNASIDYVLGSAVENLNLTGLADLNATGNDLTNTINGNDGANIIRGGLGGDLLNGNGGADQLYGQDGGDFLQGGDGADLLVGGAGGDELTGGAGADTFLFDSLTTSADRDKLRDFTPGQDVMAFSRAVFAALGGQPAGTLAANQFVNGTQALTADHHFIYQVATGNLWYDPDGVGGVAQIQIGLLSTRPTLTAADFLLI
ncbi:tandem-95 repeat protein [Sphingomonas sp. SUN019]|uniref:beta strand repeat-containing protein n=1 Tax=Sphingomonas sp. SUN019 TaxID=2937788 RepID=UPI002164C3D9|nr:tandem-95 repeat protein [Sphingomonas sp. SUN019]UVO51672.1 tandem-95 repeat protein [Sphingomonas sp. SUN019]